MALIEWREDMKVGVPVLDEDHQILVALINQLHRAMEAGEEQEVVDVTLEILAGYTVLHFKREEGYFEKTDYPGVEEHKKLHKSLTDEVMDIQERYKGGENLIAQELTDLLKDWLIDHILGVDKEYTTYLKDAGVV